MLRLITPALGIRQIKKPARPVLSIHAFNRRVAEPRYARLALLHFVTFELRRQNMDSSTEDLKQPRQNGKAADHDSDGDFSMCPEAQDDQIVCHVFGFDKIKGIVGADKRNDTGTGRRRESAIPLAVVQVIWWRNNSIKPVPCSQTRCQDERKLTLTPHQWLRRPVSPSFSLGVSAVSR